MDGITGKYGQVRTTIGGILVANPFSNWSISEEGDQVSMDGFEKVANWLGQFRKNIQIGLVGGTSTVRGRWSESKPPFLIFYPGRVFASPNLVWLGITPTIGFGIVGKVVSCNPTDELTGAADFSASIFIEDIAFTDA